MNLLGNGVSGASGPGFSISSRWFRIHTSILPASAALLGSAVHIVPAGCAIPCGWAGVSAACQLRGLCAGCGVWPGLRPNRPFTWFDLALGGRERSSLSILLLLLRARADLRVAARSCLARRETLFFLGCFPAGSFCGPVRGEGGPASPVGGQDCLCQRCCWIMPAWSLARRSLRRRTCLARSELFALPSQAV